MNPEVCEGAAVALVSADVFGTRQRLISDDGTIEEFLDGLFRLVDPSGETLEERPFTGEDATRFVEDAAAFEASLGSILNDAPRIRSNERMTRATFEDGSSLHFFSETGRFVRRDENGDRILERSATISDELAFDALERVFGGPPNGVQRDGDARDNVLNGGARNDNLFGGDGADRLSGRGGDDVLAGGDGGDRMNGGGGRDVLFGEDGDDVLNGGGGADDLFGGDDNDRLRGGGGADGLAGGAGVDELDGGEGDDFLDGGLGADELRGGAGADRFFFAPGQAEDDAIEDFEQGADRIDLSAFGGLAFENLGLSQDGDDVVIDLGAGDTVRVRNAALADFDAGDFLFD